MEGHASEWDGVNRNAWRRWSHSKLNEELLWHVKRRMHRAAAHHGRQATVKNVVAFPFAISRASTFKAIHLKSLGVSTRVLVILFSCSHIFQPTSSQTHNWRSNKTNEFGWPVPPQACFESHQPASHVWTAWTLQTREALPKKLDWACSVMFCKTRSSTSTGQQQAFPKTGRE